VKFFSRPWHFQAKSALEFTSSDCLVSEVLVSEQNGIEANILMSGEVYGQKKQLLLHPYPTKSDGQNPIRTGFIVRPKKTVKPTSQDELFQSNVMRSMHDVLDRVSELGEALEDATNMWQRLNDAWTKAQNEAEPRLSEIVRQAKSLSRLIREFDRKLRKILRRNRELTPIDRAQELDRASIRWLVRQPGKSTVERAGSSQRVMATVRRENFDTPENRVLHAYVLLASNVSKEWLQEHSTASSSERYKSVLSYRNVCKNLSRYLRDIGVGIAPSEIQPNYVLMQNPDYRRVYQAWRSLLLRQKALDELWAWQAETWADFCVIALVLSIDNMEEAQLVAQSPVAWSNDADFGRFFEQDDPFAAFWLRDRELLVEIVSRPLQADNHQFLTRSHLSVRVRKPFHDDRTTFIPVWTPHALAEFNVHDEVEDAASFLEQINLGDSFEVVRNGLVLFPAYGKPDFASKTVGRSKVDGIALDGSGTSLQEGLKNLSRIVTSTFLRGHW